MSKRPFQIFDEMNVTDEVSKTALLAMSPHLVEAKTATGGGHVVMGVTAEVITQLLTGDRKAILLVFDKKEYDRISEGGATMKHLLLFVLCQGSLDGFSQTIPPNDIRYLIQAPDGTYTIRRHTTLDTLPAHLLISHEPPSFAHSIEGYCITMGGACTGRHVVRRRRRGKWRYIDVSAYDVWGCKRKG